jgi:hypothetical protein
MIAALCYHVPEAQHMYRIVLALLLAALVAPVADARAHTSSTRTSASKAHAVKAMAPRSTTKCTSCAWDSKGRIVRSATAKHAFQKSHPCPATGKPTGAFKGYVIDHVVPLKRGCADALGNMQWQTTAAAKAKDKVE